MRIGINGFGRMGRLALRAGWERDGLRFVHVNEPKGGIDCAAHLLEFDSVHGRWNRQPAVQDGTLVVDGEGISFSEASAPGEVDWAGAGVDLVLECSGKFRTTDVLRPYLDGGVGTVVVAAPVKTEGALNLVYGVNHDLYDPARHRLLTAASCTTNCLAPVVKVVHEELGIEHGRSEEHTSELQSP